MHGSAAGAETSGFIVSIAAHLESISLFLLLSKHSETDNADSAVLDFLLFGRDA